MSTTFEDRLEQELAQAESRHRPGRQRRVPVGPGLALVAVAVVAVVLVLAAGGDRERPAPSAPPAGAIHYVRSVIEADVPGRRHERIVTEEWRRGAEAHRVERYSLGPGIDSVVDREGVMRVRFSSGRSRVVRARDNADSRRSIREARQGLVAEFEAWVAAAKPRRGTFTYAGRSARRLVHRQVIRAVDQNGNPLESSLGPRRLLYVDRRTGAPLGWTLTEHYSTPATRP